MHKRLKKLEGKGTQHNARPSFILRVFVAPSNPNNTGNCLASIIGGKSYRRCDFESDAAFKVVVDAEHQQIHG